MSSAVQHAPLMSPEEYLAGELAAETKHEFLNGVVYAMAGASKRHCDIATNILGTLFGQLRGQHCRPYGSDMLVRAQRSDDLRYYYPDVSIICRRSGPDAQFQTEPSVIFEILSPSTVRTDTGEKRLAYLTIPSLEAYVLIDSEKREVTVWRKTGEGWAPEVFTRADARIEFASADCALSVGEIYESTSL